MRSLAIAMILASWLAPANANEPQQVTPAELAEMVGVQEGEKTIGEMLLLLEAKKKRDQRAIAFLMADAGSWPGKGRQQKLEDVPALGDRTPR